MTVKPTYEELEKRVRQLEKIKSERKQVEEVLKESESKYRALYENSLEAILLTAQDGSIYAANKVACEILEKSESEIISGGRDRIVNLDDPRLPAALEERYKKGKFNGELTFKKKDGTVFPVELSSSTFQDHIGNEKACIFFRDISERKRAEESLHRERERLASIIEGTNVGTWEWNVQTGETIFNERWAEIIGYSLKEISPVSIDTWMKFTHPDDLKNSGELLQRHFSGKLDYYECEARMRHKNGEWVWVLDRGKVAVWTEDGKPLRIMGTHQDITERKRMEEHLQKFKQIVSSTADCISLVDKDYRYVIVNKTYETLSGKTQEELIGHTVAEYLGENVFYEQIKPHFDQCLNGETVKYQDWFESRNLGKRFVEVTYFPYMNARGAVEGLVGNVRDITERKRAEAEKAGLEAKVQQLQKAESLGRMAGSIAHHFNNQLSVVLGNLELVLDDLPDDADNREILVQSFEAGRKATEVSQQMLRYLGHISGSQTAINLSDVCRQSLGFLQSASPSDVTINVDFPDSGPIVHADAGQIQQVLTNLLTNAQESLPDNQGIIGLIIQTVSSEDISTSNCFPLDWHPQDKPYACLEISDTGHGISREDIEKIFDPFYTTKFTGRGMGLPVTMGILKTHNGCITVDSEPEIGTVFRVYLPVTTNKKPVKHEKVTTPKRKVGNDGTVLLIEDEVSVRNTAKIMISRLGYKVIEAQDGVEAVRLFQEHQNEIDCVLSDLTMPRMNGWETLTALRKKGADVPVILASGYDKDTVMTGNHPELPQAFLNKPYSTATLKDVLMELIRL